MAKIDKRRRRVDSIFAAGAKDLYAVNRVPRRRAAKTRSKPLDRMACRDPKGGLPMKILLRASRLRMADVAPIEDTDFQSCWRLAVREARSVKLIDQFPSSRSNSAKYMPLDLTSSTIACACPAALKASPASTRGTLP